MTCKISPFGGHYTFTTVHYSSLHTRFIPQMSTETRTDPAHDISYPNLPDARGSARVYHNRTPYYMGPHDSPLSHLVFGLWKHNLSKTGVAPSTKEIRSQVESLLKGEAIGQKPSRPKWLMAFFLSLVCVLGGWAGSKFSSTLDSPLVDGIPLSANETEFIRGRRVEAEQFENQNALLPLSRQVEMTAALNQRSVDRDALLERIRGF